MRLAVSKLPPPTDSPTAGPSPRPGRWQPRRLLLGALLVAICLAPLAALLGPAVLAASLARRAAELLAAPADDAALAAAEADLLRATRLVPDDPGPFRELARVAERRGDHAAELALRGQALRREPGSLLMSYELALAYERAGHPAAAAALWRAAGLSPLEAAMRGVGAFEAGDDRAAAAWYRRAIDLLALAGDDVPGARAALAALPADPEARRMALLRVGADVAPGHRPTLYDLGRAALAEGDWRAAVSAFGQALAAPDARDVGVSNVQHMIGRLWQYEAEPPNRELAWAAYEQALVADDFRRDRWQIAETHHQRAVLLTAPGAWALVADEERKALAANPDHGYAELGLAVALLELGRPAEAAPHARRAVELLPAQAEPNARLGQALAAAGDADGARAALRQALALDPANARAAAALRALEVAP